MPHRPILLGVVGDSASGKTTISAGIAEVVGRDRVTVICVDDYHKYNRVQRRERQVTPLHPDCNYIDIMEQHIRALGDGEPILKPVYNHQRGDFDPPEYVKPTRFVIVEGLLAFHTPRLRDAFHVKVFLDPPEELRRRWKVSRDCAKRGYRPDEVLAELARREEDSACWIRPQKQWADVVVRFFTPDRPAGSEQLDVRLTLRPTLPQPDLTPLAARDGDATGPEPVRLAVGRDAGRLAEFLEIDGRVTTEEASRIERYLWEQQPELRHLQEGRAGRFIEGVDERCSRALALSQMFIAYHLLLGRLAKEQLRRELEAKQAELLST